MAFGSLIMKLLMLLLLTMFVIFYPLFPAGELPAFA
jgi:hypothetical protein